MKKFLIPNVLLLVFTLTTFNFISAQSGTINLPLVPINAPNITPQEVTNLNNSILDLENTLNQINDPIQGISDSQTIYYLMMQMALQIENRQFSALSNVIKIKHDTSKAAISNFRS